jgi:coenzyme PQQ precursor peptide PqqA
MVPPYVSGTNRTKALFTRRCPMQWSKPEFEVVEVTMEVTAYVARR